LERSPERGAPPSLFQLEMAVGGFGFSFIVSTEIDDHEPPDENHGGEQEEAVSHRVGHGRRLVGRIAK
jgi:hypothetical protein